MSKNARDKRPYVRPVTRLELSEKNIKFRWIAIVVLLAIGVVSIGYGISAALTTEPGWQEITALSDDVNCGDDFVLMYEFRADGSNPTLQYKALESLYGELTASAFALFSAEAETLTGGNVRAVNQGINQVVSVDPALYEALELLVRYDNRHAFLAPVTELYMPVFISEGDGEAMAFDPMFDAERAALVKETAAFCADPLHVSLDVLGNNQVRLNVSEEYLEFAQEYEIETFLDFGWMANGFIIDYMAEALSEAGYTSGYLVSYDGFTRNLDVTGERYSVNFFDRQENSLLMPATFQYTSPESVVFLRDYPLSDQDRWHYYSYETGQITTVFLDPADGVSKASTDSLMAYSAYQGCGEILLQIAPVFTADSLDTAALIRLADASVYTVWAEGNQIYHTQAEPDLTLRSDSGGEGYSLIPARIR